MRSYLIIRGRRCRTGGCEMRYRSLSLPSLSAWGLTRKMWGLWFTIQCRNLWKVMYRNAVELVEIRTEQSASCTTPIAIEREMIFSSSRIRVRQGRERTRTSTRSTRSWTTVRSPSFAEGKCSWTSLGRSSMSGCVSRCAITAGSRCGSSRLTGPKRPW